MQVTISGEGRTEGIARAIKSQKDCSLTWYHLADLLSLSQDVFGAEGRRSRSSARAFQTPRLNIHALQLLWSFSVNSLFSQ